MKLGISLLIVGVILAGVGIAAWQYGASLRYAMTDTYFFGISDRILGQIVTPSGIGVAIIGIGSIIGGIVRMILKRV